MTPLRQRMIEDMQLRNFATTTQRSYIHYVADFAKHFNRSPQDLDLEAVRQYQLHLAQERKLSPQSINTFVSAVQFLYLVTLEMPWEKHDFPRARLEEKLPVVLAPDEVQRFPVTHLEMNIQYSAQDRYVFTRLTVAAEPGAEAKH